MYDERLYDFQRTGCQFIESSGGRCIIGDEMGLGKTVMALAWLESQSAIQRVLVVAPANVIHKWKREIDTWTKRHAHIVAGFSTPIPQASVTLVMSYSVMSKRYKELRDFSPELVIWDESHYLKGNRKKVQRVAAALQLKSPYVLFLSGTPFLNRPIELFNMLDMVQPGKWSLGSYGTRYCGGFNYHGGPLQGAMNLSELRSRLKSVMIRRLKRDVLEELPSLQRVLLPADIKTEEYREALIGINRTNAMTKIMDAWHIIGREKAKVAVEWVHDFFEQSEPNVKIVLYAHHLDVVDYLKKELIEYGSFSIDGRLSPERRDALARGFQTGLRPRVVIINKAGGEGIDLFGIGDIESNTLLFVERQWTPALEFQAEGRLDRIGQRVAVTAYYLMAVGTFDEPMDYTINQKRQILSATIDMEQIEMQVQGEIINGILD